MRPARVVLVASLVGLSAMLSPAVTRAGPRIYGGQPAQECQWPTAVVMRGADSMCSGTLVHPEVVVFAAHCQAPTAVRFGESSTAPARTVAVDHCARFIEEIEVGPDDYAYCRLAESVDDVPITPVLYGCETALLVPGTPAVIAGFGVTEQGGAGTKHWAQTEIVALTQMVLVGKDGTSAWQGDSGGPAYLRHGLDGSWHAFGIASGGTLPGMPIQYVPMHTSVPWVESMSGVDITPCHDVDGAWNPGPDCGFFATDPTMVGSWNEGCSAQAVPSGPSGTCGVPSVDDDAPPVVAITNPADGAEFADVPALVDVEVDAIDEHTGIRRVWLEVDGDEVNEDGEAPYGFAAIELEAGAHALVAGAEDLAGNVARSDAVGIVVGEDDDGTSDGGEAPGEGGDGGCECGAARFARTPGVGWLLLALVVRRRSAGSR